MARTPRYGGPYTSRSGPHAGQTFPSYLAYRNQVAQDEGYKNYYEKRHAPRWHEVFPLGIPAEQYGNEDGRALRGKPDLVQLQRKLREFGEATVIISLYADDYIRGYTEFQWRNKPERASGIVAEIGRILEAGRVDAEGPVTLAHWLGEGTLWVRTSEVKAWWVRRAR